MKTQEDKEEKDDVIASASNEVAHCTPGHELQCQMARSAKCDCNCNGANHGKGLKKSSPEQTQKVLDEILNK